MLNDRFTSRQNQRDAGKRTSAEKGIGQSTSSTPVKHISVRPKEGIKLFEAYTKERELRLQRLDKLLEYPGLPPEEKRTYQSEYKKILEEPVITLQSCLYQSGDMQSPLSDRSYLASPCSLDAVKLSYDPVIDETLPSIGQYAVNPDIIGGAAFGAASFVTATEDRRQTLAAPFASRTCEADVPEATVSDAQSKDFYLQWLESTEQFIVPAAPHGACLFESTLHCIKEIYYSNDGSKWKEDSIIQMKWEEATVDEFRQAILSMMRKMQNLVFDSLTNLGAQSFSGMILEEGLQHGIVDYACRDSGNPPQLYKSTAEYFDLMKSSSAYGNMSALMAIAILCDVTVNVWIAPSKVPEVFNEGKQHTINLVKKDRGSHYDALSKNALLRYLRHGEPQGDRTYTYSIDCCPLHGGSGMAYYCFFCRQCLGGDDFYEAGVIKMFGHIPTATHDQCPHTPGGAADPEDATRQNCEHTISPGLINPAVTAEYRQKRVALSKQHDAVQAALDVDFYRRQENGTLPSFSGTIYDLNSSPETIDIPAAQTPQTMAAAESGPVAVAVSATIPISTAQNTSQRKSKVKAATASFDRKSMKILEEHGRHANYLRTLPKKNVINVVFGCMCHICIRLILNIGGF
jgi:hypothetical protein